MSNIAATYIGIIAGFVLGGLIFWWIYNRQEKTAVKHQEILDHIANLRKAWTYFRKDTNSWAKSRWNVKQYFDIRYENKFLVRKK